MSDQTEPKPIRQRATDDQRNLVVNELSAAISRGQLTLSEFEERSTLAWSARFLDELQELVGDIQLAGSSLSLPPQAAVASTAVPASASSAVARIRSLVTGQPGGSSLSMSIMGGANRTGSWLCPREHISITIMGGNTIDLREASFEDKDITINAFTLMGGIDIIAPEGFRVICEGVGIMGGFDASTSPDSTIPQSSLPHDAPTLRIGGIALMGGVTVQTKPRS